MNAHRYIWPAVVAFLGALAAVVVILVLVPPDNVGAQQAVVTILGILGSALGSLFVYSRVAEVHKQVNGRMSQLIDKLPPESDET